MSNTVSYWGYENIGEKPFYTLGMSTMKITEYFNTGKDVEQ